MPFEGVKTLDPSGFLVAVDGLPVSVDHQLMENMVDSLSGVVPGVSVIALGADSSGVVDAVPAITAAISSLADGGTVVLPPGTFQLDKDGVNAWCLNITASNLVIQGATGRRSRLRMAPGQPHATKLVNVDSQTNITFRDIIFDGNWGGVVNVTDSVIDGINHDDAVAGDPHCHIVVLRGCQYITFENCEFTGGYGDAIWSGYSADDDTTNWTRYVKLLNCKIDMMARNGFTIGQSTAGVLVDGCQFTNCFAQTFDTEAQGSLQPVRDVTIINSTIAGWWNPANASRTQNIVLSIVGGQPLAAGEGNLARHFRIINNTLLGSTLISSAADVVLRDNEIVCDHAGKTYAPVFADHFLDDLSIEGNTIYDRCTGDPPSHEASILIQYYGDGTINYQPANVSIVGNRIHSKNGRSGIKIAGAGGAASGTSGAVKAWQTGTATSIGATAMGKTAAGWTIDEWRGWRVRLGSSQAAIISNTATDLTLTGWTDPRGNPVATPALGTFIIYQVTGNVLVEGNTIDLTDDGRGAGLYGVHIAAERAGQRVRVANNTIINATNYGVYVVSANSGAPMLLCEVVDNTGYDNQATATFSYLVNFSVPCYITKLILRNNKPVGATFPLPQAGIASGTTPKHWLINDGPVQQWAGYGTPEAAVTAPIGSTCVVLDGGVSTTLYVKTSGTGNTGWTAK